MNEESRPGERLPQRQAEASEECGRAGWDRSLRLVVRRIERDVIEFEGRLGGAVRPVTVLLGFGAPQFPHPLSDGGESFDDPELDVEVVEAARELLVVRGRRRYRRRR